MDDARCPCGGALAYEQCCGPLHRGAARAATAEQLMRSRYAAFARDEVAYLLTSWHPSTRPATLAATGGLRWRRLEVLATSGGGLLDTEGTVEFRAWFDGPAGRGSQHEVSRFVRGADGWQYLDEVPPASGRGPV